MTIEELKQQFVPKRCSSQAEFDRFMNELNHAQTEANHPYLDEARDLNMQNTLLRKKIHEIQVVIAANNAKKLELEQDAKDINRACWEIKHQLIALNPVDGWPRKEEGNEQV